MAEKSIAGGIFSSEGVLLRALVLGPFTAPDYETAFRKDYLDGEATADATSGTLAGGRR